METVFLQIFGMSITACYVIVFVLVARLTMKKIPRFFSYILWTAVLFRLICPLSFENPFSLIPSVEGRLPAVIQELSASRDFASEQLRSSKPEKGDGVANGSALMPFGGGVGPKGELSGDWNDKLSDGQTGGFSGWNDNLSDGRNGELSEVWTGGLSGRNGESREDRSSVLADGWSSNWLSFATAVWLAVMGGLLCYSIFTCLRLKRKLSYAVKVEGDVYNQEGLGDVSEHGVPWDVYELKGLDTPFVFGLRPKIYLPEGITGVERNYILNHERTHIKRGDHIIKPIAFAVLCIHWFNPLVWLAYHLMCEDMELSCDESVLKKMGSEIKKEYSRSLLNLSCRRSLASGSPLAFGENNVKARIKNILNYKKPSAAVIAIAVIVVTVLCVGLISDPLDKKPTLEDFAEQFVQNQVDLYNQSEQSGFRITESDITAFEKLDEFDTMMEAPVGIWRLEYRLKPDDPSKVMLAGGMNMIDGWLTEESSMGKPLLVFSMEEKGPRYLGSMNSGEDMNGSIATKAGRETMLRVFLERQNLVARETYQGEHIVVKFPLSTGETCQLLLSRPVKKDASGIWCVERWMDGNGTVYYDTPATTSGTALEYYKAQQEQSDNGQNTWLLDPIAVSLHYINDVLGQKVTSHKLELQNDALIEDFEKTPESNYIGYISNWKSDENGTGDFSFHLDVVEWLTLEDIDRLKELKLSPDQLPSGFYIYNPNSYPAYFEGKDYTVFRIIEAKTEVRQIEITREEFEKYLKRLDQVEPSFQIPFRIVTKDGFVQSIEEQYLP